ncbi:MAG: hypothetical protein M5U28_39490 [Sandaracinaceae bacterium]|nr:hypothetical protein [Sandaracinaceae bacterium]
MLPDRSPTVLHVVHLLVALSLHGPSVPGEVYEASAWRGAAEVEQAWEPASGTHRDPGLTSVDDVEDSDEDPRAAGPSRAGVTVRVPDGTHARRADAPAPRRRADSVAAHAPRGPPIA